ncbi:acetylxylan esterase, partial [Nocardioides hankookensis]
MDFDLPLDEARVYRPPLAVPDDLEEFWARTLARIGTAAPTFTRVDSGLVAVETYDVTLAGFDGDPVRAWLHLPASS